MCHALSTLPQRCPCGTICLGDGKSSTVLEVMATTANARGLSDVTGRPLADRVSSFREVMVQDAQS